MGVNTQGLIGVNIQKVMDSILKAGKELKKEEHLRTMVKNILIEKESLRQARRKEK